jgi:hypothetical protein
VKNEQVTALIKPHQRVTVPDVEEQTESEQLELELAEEKPAREGKRAKTLTKPARKVRAKVK